ncbi:aminoglycoside phosphotransferase family protein [Streptomyces sp. NPDC048604]|uniref:aminoglycoside phosphotransferase family protein n=1 Tax=Streptomyces sp. NPDC048604 TaxID=3365578 RepID=UPI0037185804
MRHDTDESVDRGGLPRGGTPWDDLAWRDAALDWACERLAEHGLRERGREPDAVAAQRDGAAAGVRLRPWSVLVRFPVRTVGEGHETVWFKANPPAARYEAGLAQALAVWTPDHVLAPLAVDTDRGWSLLPDGGPLFADALDRGPDDPRAWEAPLRQYAALQRALTGRSDELRALGVPDARAAVLPGVFDRLVEDCRALEPADRKALLAQRPRLVEWCDELAASGIPDSLDHSDLHESQIFARGRGRYAFFDWGDAAVAHPFATLLVTGRMARRRFGPEALPRLRDVYLEAWTGGGTPTAELRRAVALATRLGAVHRAVCWGLSFPAPDGDPVGDGDGDTDGDGDARAGGEGAAEATARWLRELFAEPGLWDAE